MSIFDAGSARVELDTRKLEAGVKQMMKGIERNLGPAAEKVAGEVADRLRSIVPVDTGALRSSVRSARIKGGAAVHYGGSLSYADIIAARTGCTEEALEGSDEMFHEAQHDVAAREVRRL